MTTTIHILVVGDDEETCIYLTKILSAKDWQSDMAWIGSKALELARTKTYDAVVFDYRKPGLDGADVCRRIRETQPGAREVFVTGNPRIDAVYQAMEAAHERVLAKPVDPTELDSGSGRTIGQDRMKRPVEEILDQTSESMPQPSGRPGRASARSATA